MEKYLMSLYRRTTVIIDWLAFIVMCLLTLIWSFFRVMVWFILIVCDLLLLLPMLCVWLLTGKNYMMGLEPFVNDKTHMFEDFYY
jgi:hypothetical protein